MCDPVSIALAATAGGTVLGAVGDVTSSQFAAHVAKRNAAEAMGQAELSVQRGIQAAAAKGLQTAHLASSQQLAAAGSGLDVGYGTPLDIVGDTALIGQLDALTIIQNAGYEERGYKAKAAGLMAEAKAKKNEGIQKAFGTILGGVAKAAGGFPDFFGGTGSTAAKTADDSWMTNWATTVSKE